MPNVALKALVTDRMLLAAYLGFLEFVPFVLGVLLLQRLNGRNDQLQGFVCLLRIIDDEAGVLVLFRAVVHGPTTTSLLHVDEFGHVCAEQGVNPLSFSVSIDVKLNVCWKSTGAGGAARGGVCGQFAAQPVSVEVS